MKSDTLLFLTLIILENKTLNWICGICVPRASSTDLVRNFPFFMSRFRREMQREWANTATPFCQDQVSVNHPQQTALPNSKTACTIQGHKSCSYPHAPAIPLPLVSLVFWFFFSHNCKNSIIISKHSGCIHHSKPTATFPQRSSDNHSLLVLLVPFWIVMNIYAHFHHVPPGLHRAQVVSAAETFH